MRRLLLAGLLTAAPGLAWAIYVPLDLVDVPLDRILANLEARLAKNPEDATLHHALARAHSIAYAQGVSSLRLARPGYRGSEPKQPPDERQLADATVPPSLDPNRRGDAVSRRHLEQALAHYREAARLDPQNLAVALGHGWALEQSRDDVLAREQYRAVLRKAFDKQQYDLALEAGTYLKALLSPLSQARERAEVEKTLADVERRSRERPRFITPIVIPLVDDAPFDALVSRDAAVEFDLDASGVARRWQWITPQAGWLVYQGSGERGIDSATRVIGSRSFWIFWRDGYDALAALDDDANGWLSGPELSGLAIWRDADASGVVDAGEVRPVGDWGIVALACAGIAHPEGFPFSPRGVVFADGAVRPSYDWIATSTPFARSTAMRNH